MVAEEWPSWSFALNALGVTEITTVLPSASQRVVQEVKETVVGSSLMEFDAWKAGMNGQPLLYDVVFIQGSDYFVSEMRGKLDPCEERVLVGIVPDDQRTRSAGSLVERAWPEGNVIRMNHQQAGGVTRGQWKVYSSIKLSGLKSSPVKRVLQHILVSTETGMELTAGAHTQGLIHPHQRLPSQARNVRLAAPCCFVKNKALVERDITDKELMSAYDIEESVQQALSQYSLHTGKELTRAFSMEAPIKVLYPLSELVLQAYLKPPNTHTHGNTDQSATVEEANGIRNSDGDQSEEPIGSKRPAKSLVGPKLKRPKVTMGGTSDPKSQVATKNDDAPVEVTDWDV